MRAVGCPVLHPGRPHRSAPALGDRPPDSLHRPGGAGLSRACHRLRARRLSVDRGDGRRCPQARERLHRHLGLHHETTPRRTHPVHENRQRTAKSAVRHQLSDDRACPCAGRPRRPRTERRRPPRLFACQRRTGLQGRHAEGTDVNGAHALINTLVDGGVDVCFANPGTSEMHFVAALDSAPRMRSVLTLFEGVATGAADGYARIAGTPAAVLVHLGPGLANGLANLHNARRARVPMVVVVGDHATYHKKYDAPLESDIDALAASVSGWVRRSRSTGEVAADAAEAITTSRASQHISTLILPADVSWSDGATTARAVSARRTPVADIDRIATVLRSGEPTVVLVGGDATRESGLTAAARIATATGTRWYCETFPTRLQRGAGRPVVERLAYFAEAVTAQLDGAKHLVLAGAKSPVSFFAYPGRPSDLVPKGCEVHHLADGVGAADALIALAEEVAPGIAAPLAAPSRPVLPTGSLTAASAADVVGALMPEDVIVVDESNTSGPLLAQATA